HIAYHTLLDLPPRYLTHTHILCADWVCRVNRQTAVFHNSILEEIRKELKVLEDSIESLENKIL
ncbi:MAG: hypothetical protein LUF02_08970, partial [Erysipelotrichaceae bacterium]|nr:hypothetical protein [Erysipelotrichaceae bacterium]